MMQVSGGLEECKEIATPSDIPCRVTTTWEPSLPCSQYMVRIFDDNGTNLSVKNLTGFGVTSFCQFNFTFTDHGDYPYNITTGDTGNILVQSEDEMTSLAVTLFIMAINIALFVLPSFISFNKNPVLDNLMKKMTYIGGLLFLAFNTTIIVSLADNAGLGINTELFRYQWLFLWGIYFSLLFLFWNMIVSTIKLWRIEKIKKRMGEE